MIRRFPANVFRILCIPALVLAVSALDAQEAAKVSATIKPNSLFADHMVLQRDKPLPVWGTATAGDEITVSFRQQKVTAKADATGKWAADLKPEAAGGPDVMTISGKDGAVTAQNVLVGEVWLWSGQSNMAFQFQRADPSSLPSGVAADPSFRMFTLGMNAQDSPVAAAKGRWTEVTPETDKGMSAVAYFFGADLRKNLDVPVGIIVSAVGGTSASAWTSVEGFEAATDATKEVYIKGWADSLAKYPELKAQYDKDLAAYNERKAAFESGAAATPSPSPEATVSAAAAGKALELIEAGAENAAAKAPKTFEEKPPRAPLGKESAKRPYGLFNGMLNPLIPYAIRGFVWYQGETDAPRIRAAVYPDMLRTMITDWRTRWNEKALPFLIVQLPGFAQGGEGWVTLQQAQAAVAKDSGNGMVVTIDVGEKSDVHPRNKQPVGQRLANLALADVYGMKVPSHSPEPASVAKSGSEVRVTFKTDGEAKLVTKPEGAPVGFTLGGADGLFVPAQARVEGNVVILTSTVADPKTVRYAFSSWPEVGVFDANTLPAGPFEMVIP